MKNGLRIFGDAVAIVTGAASGIGRALAEELALRDCQVVLADIELDGAEAVAAQIRASGGRAAASRLDVRNFSEVNELVAGTMRELGRIDYIFNNAGIAVTGEVADYTIDSWDRIIGVNLGGVINGVQAAYPVMIQQGFGHIVNTASIAGLTTAPGLASYAATKHAIVGFTKALRVEAAFRGVRASVLCPGVIRTPIISGGKHGVLLMPVPEETQREITRQAFERLHPMDASKFARKVLNQVARNRAIIIVPGWYKLLLWLERLSPFLGDVFARNMFEGLREAVSSSKKITQQRGPR
jgi:NAD(P)-dependent dehydrogenase (short-subunit alcohol dehydrogenase family)